MSMANQTRSSAGIEQEREWRCSPLGHDMAEVQKGTAHPERGSKASLENHTPTQTIRNSKDGMYSPTNLADCKQRASSASRILPVGTTAGRVVVPPLPPPPPPPPPHIRDPLIPAAPSVTPTKHRPPEGPHAPRGIGIEKVGVSKQPKSTIRKRAFAFNSSRTGSKSTHSCPMRTPISGFGFGRRGKAKGDLPGVRFKVVKVSGVGLLALWKRREFVGSSFRYSDPTDAEPPLFAGEAPLIIQSRAITFLPPESLLAKDQVENTR
ncbi:hypothetical protein F5148DRAFT_1365922 [Russula earlei]|uniref:Uncharacterized protein n=1 Tax=Russula earlei TaxID=71964 RepID=A0ACC0UII1_9AGAM|nr:hypothetical protein F5148DRAFT_1365922 [Russula earlei]